MTGKLESAFGEADQSPGLMLWRVTNKWQATMRSALAPFELTHVQFVLLANLVWLDSEDPVTQQALAASARTDPMMTSQVVRALEAKGLLTRSPHPHDSRARALVATEVGIALANRAIGAVEASDAQFFDLLGTEQAAFVRHLGVLDSISD